VLLALHTLFNLAAPAFKAAGKQGSSTVLSSRHTYTYTVPIHYWICGQVDEQWAVCSQPWNQWAHLSEERCRCMKQPLKQESGVLLPSSLHGWWHILVHSPSKKGSTLLLEVISSPPFQECTSSECTH